jgi:hypothetical protein
VFVKTEIEPMKEKEFETRGMVAPSLIEWGPKQAADGCEHQEGGYDIFLFPNARSIKVNERKEEPPFWSPNEPSGIRALTPLAVWERC